MRPTGPLHIGHLVGALDNWRRFQEQYDSYYMVADWHALMSEYHDSGPIAKHTIGMVAEWIACGLDPKVSTIFVQSQVPQHAELHLIFSTVTPISWVERVPTYKEQLKELAAKDVNTYAFLGYPVLQAADILVYGADAVPVGDDQLPHLELTREIARRFNSLFGEVFKEPQARLTPTPRLLGLDRRKMSKSYDNAIALAEEPDSIRKRIMTAITDPKRIKFSDPGHPEECNVCSYYQVFFPDFAPEAGKRCRESQWGCTDCKRNLGDLFVKLLTPIREKRAEILKDPNTVRDILAEGRRKATAVARETMERVHKALRF
jgi:tryptophanyl-tRNA synthetase